LDMHEMKTSSQTRVVKRMPNLTDAQIRKAAIVLGRVTSVQ